MNNPQRLSVHATMTPPSRSMSLRDVNLRDRKLGFMTIGYHYVITRDGVIHDGRSPGLASPHVRLSLSGYTQAVCLVGGEAEGEGGPEDNFTPFQWAALRLLRKRLGDPPCFTHADAIPQNRLDALD